MENVLKELKSRMEVVEDIGGAMSVLGWDQRTYMPPGGAQARAEQLSTLSKLHHEHFTDAKIGSLLEELMPHSSGESDDARYIFVTNRDYQKSRKFPTEFVAEWTKARALSEGVWEKAREKKDFAMFLPHLETMFDYAKRAADYLGYKDHPYDALLDQYEPGMTTAQVSTLFQELRDGSIPLLKKIVEEGSKVDDSPVHQQFDEDKQEQFGIEVTKAFGYDWTRGRQDRTVHPFCTSFSNDDVRITTRFQKDFLNPALFGTMHEAGHAMYEQGVSPSLRRSPLGSGTSLGIHESQSRMWENLVGRSRTFWKANYSKLQALFPDQLGKVSQEDFYRAINKVQPSFIRVEADELTYNMHIMLRFELEAAVLGGELAVKDLPAAWNEKMQKSLGITPPDDAEGVLQDTHWSGGGIGYFPTYTLGNVISVQLWEVAHKAHPQLQTEMESNNYTNLLGWLRKNVHQYGRKLDPNDLITKATGSPLTAKPYLRYLHSKFGDIYGVKV